MFVFHGKTLFLSFIRQNTAFTGVVGKGEREKRPVLQWPKGMSTNKITMNELRFPPPQKCLLRLMSRMTIVYNSHVWSSGPKSAVELTW